MSTASFILSEDRGPVRVLTFNRPEVLNAWNGAMKAQFRDALLECERDEAVRAVVLTGAGDRAFGAGQDLEEAREFDGERAAEWVDEFERLYDAIRGLSKPIVVALNGTAAGSAFQVALLGDFRIGHADVRMGQPEINSGIPTTTGSWIMREIIGLARTIDLTLTGRLLDAAECERIGLINRLVPQQEVLSAALELAAELAAKPPVAMRINKQRFRQMTEPGLQDALAVGRKVQREAYASGEPARMMEAFLARRAARSK